MVRLKVPLLKQGHNECGPTSLRMTLLHFGKDIPQHEIIKGAGGIKDYGVETIHLAEYARSLGFKVHCYSFNKEKAEGKATLRKPSKADLVGLLEGGSPVIITVVSSLLPPIKPSGKGHFIVLTGHEKDKFWYNDPKDGMEHTIGGEDLLFAWFNNTLHASAYLLALKPHDLVSGK